MNKILKICSLSILVLTAFSCNQKKTIEKKTSESEKKPNIIYILADDLGYGDLSSYGQEKFNTPNIDKLVTQGLMFTQHYAGNTVCAPSRSALLTGMHTGHTPIRGNREVQPEGQHPIPDSTYTMAEALKKGGYVTGAFGKWGLGYPGSEGDPIKQGFDVFYGYNCQRLGHNYYPYHLWSNKDSIVLKGNEGNGRGQYAPELIQNKALEFLEKNKDTTFFLYVPTIIPHAELAAPENLIDKYRGKYLPEKEFKGTDDGPQYRLGKYESQKESHAAFVAMIEVMDNQVGEIMDKVKELGLEDNTIVVFTSDNGPHTEGGADPKYFNSNGQLRGVKRDLYEGGIRVPMTIRWPNKIKPGTKTDLISAFWDVFPTFSEIAGIEAPENIDGISFLPTLLDKPEEQKQHDYLYWEFHERGGRQAIRKGNWKAVKYNVKKKPNATMQLFDLSTDIGETNNIADKHPEIVEEMKQLFKEARTPSNVFKFNQVSF
ncbi:arylsulfatase [Polaribacter sargassicola]|uniref:arylsulfatase n=1 Tax=Polaribacter sargassicola TaxID=2836891 RepID=UPI001F1CE699|nr:arylsulfatase [Polaribacter sp. DS7-9]MCG1035822.1 arylsulfatase [Polaribacter sp. DS7-9]